MLQSSGCLRSTDTTLQSIIPNARSCMFFLLKQSVCRVVLRLLRAEQSSLRRRAINEIA